MSTSLYVPNQSKTVSKAWFADYVTDLRNQRELLRNMFFLVKQGDAFGERLKCVKCGERHDYITLNCVERPFTGVTGGLYAYYHLIKDNGVLRYMDEGERARYDAITETLHDIPNLANQHPETARKIAQELGPSDAKIGAVSIGILEGIARKHALRLVEKINDRGLRPKLVLDEPNPYDKLMMELRRGT